MKFTAEVSILVLMDIDKQILLTLSFEDNYL